MSEKRIRPRANGRERLLVAAEKLFSDRGYFGASVRDITQAAGVPLGLATYHFRSKDELFREVLLRRVFELSAALDSALEAADASDLQAILEAYAKAHLDRLASEDPGWRFYIRLVAVSTLQPIEPGLVEPIVQAYAPVLHRFREALEQAAPEIDRRLLDRVYYIFQRSVLGICAESLPHSPGTDFDPDELATTLAEITARGLGGGRNPAPSAS